MSVLSATCLYRVVLLHTLVKQLEVLKNLYTSQNYNYPRATRCGGDIVTLLWFCACVCASVRGPCEHDRDYTVACFFVKLGRYVNHDERMNPIDFGGQRSRSQWTYMEKSL